MTDDGTIAALREALADIRDGQATDDDIRVFKLDVMDDQRGTNWSMWAIWRATEALADTALAARAERERIVAAVLDDPETRTALARHLAETLPIVDEYDEPPDDDWHESVARDALAAIRPVEATKP